MNEARVEGMAWIVGGTLLTIGGIAFAIWVVATTDSRPRTGLALSIPIGMGILAVGKGLARYRSGTAPVRPEWLDAVNVSAEGQEFQLLATGTGVYQTWVLDQTRLIDHKGKEYDLSALKGGRTHEQRGTQGWWQAQLTLLFPGAKTSIKAFEQRPGPNKRAFESLSAEIHAVMKRHNPDAEFKSGAGRSQLIGVLLVPVVVGLVIGVVYIASLLAG